MCLKILRKLGSVDVVKFMSGMCHLQNPTLIDRSFSVTKATCLNVK